MRPVDEHPADNWDRWSCCPAPEPRCAATRRRPGRTVSCCRSATFGMIGPLVRHRRPLQTSLRAPRNKAFLIGPILVLELSEQHQHAIARGKVFALELSLWRADQWFAFGRIAEKPLGDRNAPFFARKEKGVLESKQTTPAFNRLPALVASSDTEKLLPTPCPVSQCEAKAEIFLRSALGPEARDGNDELVGADPMQGSGIHGITGPDAALGLMHDTTARGRREVRGKLHATVGASIVLGGWMSSFTRPRSRALPAVSARPKRQAPIRSSAAAINVTVGPKLPTLASVVLWCAEICGASRTPLSSVEWPSDTTTTS